jgi:hypothetical protein
VQHRLPSFGAVVRMLMMTSPAAMALLDRAQPRVLAVLDSVFSWITLSEEGDVCRLLENLGREVGTRCNNSLKEP